MTLCQNCPGGRLDKSCILKWQISEQGEVHWEWDEGIF